MSKVRVYQLAKELNISNKELLEHLSKLGVEAASHSSSIEEEAAALVREALTPGKNPAAPVKKSAPAPVPPVQAEKVAEVKEVKPAKAHKEKEPQETKPAPAVQEVKAPAVESPLRVIKLPDSIVLSELAAKLEVNGNELIKTLIGLGHMFTINQLVPFNVAEKLAENYNCLVEKLELYGEDLLEEEMDSPAQLTPRAPVVTIMGHVDHGKTKLLDAIRKTDVVSSEAGGITQHIGAYHVEVEKGHIVFLDTPGHEAFTAMRARGAQVTDIVVLVVAADDGVMPQTIEAIDHAKAAGVPIVVAINKIDKPDANPDRVKQQLSDYGLMPESWGGQTIFVEISAKSNINIDGLLEMILLQAEILELKANKEALARGTVIEAKLDKGRGAVATVLIQRGTLKVGDAFVVGSCYGKVRAMFDDRGRQIKSAGPATATEILGFNGIPHTGDTFQSVRDEKTARDIGRRRQEIAREQGLRAVPRVTLEDLFSQIEANIIKDLRIIIKTDVRGSAEAITKNLSKLKSSKVQIKILHMGVGAISTSDVMLAAASNAIVIAFNVTAEAEAAELAKREKVDIRFYSIIYNINDDIVKAMEGLLEPTFEEVITGHAEVRQLFKVPKQGYIAGSYITDGFFKRNSRLRIKREGKVLFEGKLTSLKRFKDDVKEIKAGMECGIGVDGFNDLQEADIIEGFELKSVAGKL